MAAGQIRVTPEQMRTRASNFRTEGQNFDTVINKMQSLINQLQQEWEGQASQQFAQQFAGLKPNFQKVRDLINEIGGQLDATATSIEELDIQISQKFQ